jgi:hypothetical protein
VLTNHSDISLALAVWLVHDEYDYIDTPNYISATAMMKPLRQIVLTPRVPKGSQDLDIESLIASALGKSIHDSIEKSWIKGYARSLKLLGYPEDAIERIRINPSDDEVRGSNSIIPIYLEQRLFREVVVNGVTYTIGGKFDLITDGILQDAKSTTVFAWTKGGKDDDYILQKSIYRWLDAGQPMPKITEDYGRINFIFTDWQKFAAKQDPSYPQSRVRHKDFDLLSLKDTEAWIRQKLGLIQKYSNAKESTVPECTDAELWRSEPQFKYYTDPTKTDGKSSKNFSSLAEANAHRAEKAKGIVITKLGEPKRCGYCQAFSVCSQQKRYFL